MLRTVGKERQATVGSIQDLRGARRVRGQCAQLSLFVLPEPENPALEALRGLDVMRLTPIETINRLYELQQMARGAG